jgi:hypothetical protein
MGEFKLIIIPDPDEPEAAEVYVDGHVGGRPYRFLLDTGAARSTWFWMSIRPRSTVSGHTFVGCIFPVSDDLITMPGIEIGPISRRNFTLARAAAASGKPNLVGMDLLKGLRCHFLFEEQRVVVDADDASESGYAFEPLVLGPKFHPYLDVQFGDVHAQAVWDTGASLTVVDVNFIHRQPAFFEEVGHSTGTDAAGTQMETPMFVMSAAVIGRHTFPPHRVAGVDLSNMPMDLILGYSTWSKANWLFDFPGKKWVISKWLGVP